MFTEASRLSRSSSEYSTSWPKTTSRDGRTGTAVVRPHSGWLLGRNWIHIAAVSVTAGLTAINILNLYLMDVENPNTITILNAFQFAAKLHEVLIVGSLMLVMMGVFFHVLRTPSGLPLLSRHLGRPAETATASPSTFAGTRADVVADTVRSRLIASAGVPFGQILAPVLFNDLDWLISHQFWSSVKPRHGSLGLTALVLLAVPFANIAGPLSAIVVLPRLGWSNSQPAAVFPSFWNVSGAALWPKELTASALDPSCSGAAGSPGAQKEGCPAMPWVYVSAMYNDNDTSLCTITGADISCNASLVFDQTRPFSIEYNVDSLSMFTSTPTRLTYNTLSNRFSAGIASGLQLPNTASLDAQKSELIETRFFGNKGMLKPIANTTCLEMDYSEVYEMVQDLNLNVSWRKPTVHWVGDIDGSSNAAFLLTYMRNDSRNLGDASRSCDGQDCYSAIRCNSDARWVPYKMWYNTAQATIFQNDPQPKKLFESGAIKSAPRAIIRKDWLDVLDVQTAIDTGNTMSRFLNRSGVPIEGKPRVSLDRATQGSLRPTNYTQAVSVFFGSIVTESLAQTGQAFAGLSLYTGDCSDTVPGFTFAPEICKKSPSDWIRVDELGSLQDGFSMAAFTVRRSGYGWFTDSITVKIALGILLFHGLLTLGYLIASIAFRRQITTSWSSAPEMLMLAVDSLRAPVLMGSSAKAAHKNLWREPVSVMEVDGGERVTLVVGDPLSYPDRLGGPPVLGKKYN